MSRTLPAARAAVEERLAADPDWREIRESGAPRSGSACCRADDRTAATAEQVLAGFPDYFGWVLDDLRALVSPYPIIAEGWGLRPELVAGVADRRRMVVLAPTDDWQERQAATLPRARAVTAP